MARYQIKLNSETRMSKAGRMLLYVVMFMLGLLYMIGFAYYATEPDPFIDQSVQGR